jgi:hypothetical protein
VRVRFAASIALVLATLRALSSCTDAPIVIASVPASDAGTPAEPVACLSLSDCPGGTFCSKTSCSADAVGSCQLFPAYCDPTEKPVCGCDQITYFNTCLRQSAGIVFETANECAFDNATPCAGEQNLDCPDGSQCARLLGSKGPCQDDFPGTCWALPATCPTPIPGADRWDSCANPSMSCLDTCTAISGGGAFQRSPPCSPPPGQ